MVGLIKPNLGGDYWRRCPQQPKFDLRFKLSPRHVCRREEALEDKVEWHWRRIVAGAALSTLIGVGAELATPNRSDRDGAVIIATREGLQDTVNQVGQQITRRNLELQPTLTVRAGHPLRVIVHRDLVFDPE